MLPSVPTSRWRRGWGSVQRWLLGMTRVRPWRPLLLGCFGITWRDMKGDCSIHFEKRLAIWTLRVDEGGGIGTWLFLWNKGTCDLYAQVGRSTGLSENWAWWLGGLNPYNLDLEKSHVKPLLTGRREPQLGMLWDAFSSCGPPSSGYKVEYSSMTACSFVQTFLVGAWILPERKQRLSGFQQKV